MKFKYQPLPGYATPGVKPGDVITIRKDEAEFYIRSWHWQEVKKAEPAQQDPQQDAGTDEVSK